MNRRELAFCAHYHVHRNAEAAVKAAGYSVNSKSQGGDILRRPHIQEQLNFLAMQSAEIIALDKGVVVNELGAIALTRPSELMKKVDGRWVGKLPEELNDRQMASVREIRVREVWEMVEGVRTFIRQEYKYIQYDKMRALEKLGDHFGLGEEEDPGLQDVNPFRNASQDQLAEMNNFMKRLMDSKPVSGEILDG